MLMSGSDASRPRLVIRVVYVDLPDMIEIEAVVIASGWAGLAWAYTDPVSFRDSALGLRQWAERPSGNFVLEAGEDTGIGWIHLRWVSNEGRGAIPCHVQLAARAGVPENCWRLRLTTKAEPWALERFA